MNKIINKLKNKNEDTTRVDISIFLSLVFLMATIQKVSIYMNFVYQTLKGTPINK